MLITAKVWVWVQQANVILKRQHDRWFWTPPEQKSATFLEHSTTTTRLELRTKYRWQNSVCTQIDGAIKLNLGGAARGILAMSPSHVMGVVGQGHMSLKMPAKVLRRFFIVSDVSSEDSAIPAESTLLWDGGMPGLPGLPGGLSGCDLCNTVHINTSLGCCWLYVSHWNNALRNVLIGQV